MKYDSIAALIKTGISEDDAISLRRISMTLRRWYELECGSDSGAVARDETTDKPYWLNAMTGERSRAPFPDREKGAKKRLAAIMARYPDLEYYLQTDPRGASLYILHLGDVPAGTPIDACYSRGVAVCR